MKQESASARVGAPRGAGKLDDPAVREFRTYRMPTQVLDGASSRLLRLLGKHEKGPYG